MNESKMTDMSYNYCALPLAAYASRADQSQGRVHAEPDSAHRTAFQRDRDRIIHASAFRRLKYKTQVFVYHEGDHYRTRLTHTLEVAQITRSIARALMVNEDLAEAIALAHDLGHTPFAHMGEDFLKICMAPYGGFDHNDQSLRVVTTLERKYPEWNGLNLSWEVLEGIIKHNGPVHGDLHIAAQELQNIKDMRLDTNASLESQIAALSDDVAYNNHDVEDGLRAGLFHIQDLEEMPLLSEALSRVRERYKDLRERYLVQEMIREMIGMMVEDILQTVHHNLKSIEPKSPEDIRVAKKQIVSFSDGMRMKVDELRRFLFSRMYEHYSINRIRLKVERIITDLFHAFLEHPETLPDNWQRRMKESGAYDDEQLRARVVADYIAGMTDRYAIREHERLFDVYWDLR